MYTCTANLLLSEHSLSILVTRTSLVDFTDSNDDSKLFYLPALHAGLSVFNDQTSPLQPQFHHTPVKLHNYCIVYCMRPMQTE